MPTIKVAKSEESQSQAAKFKAMAKELEADGDEKGFDEKLKQISARRSGKNKG